jgi:Uma2 family endonuclease
MVGRGAGARSRPRGRLLGVSTGHLPLVYRLTYADWAASPDDGLRREIIGGELFVTPPPAIKHQRISREIEFRLLTYLRERERGEVLNAPVGLCLSGEDVVEPDLVVVLTESRATIGEQAIFGAADLVVEILSPGTAKRDLVVKRALYESAGVREYWVVDPEGKTVEVLRLDGAAYVRHGLFEREHTLTSSVLAGLELALAEVFSKV